MENQKINQICEEIFRIEPSLKNDEKTVRKIVVNLLEARPGIAPDSAFVNNLRAQVLSRRLLPAPKPAYFNFLWKPYLIIPAGLIATALILAITLETNPQKPKRFTALKTQAFGKIVALDTGKGGDAAEEKTPRSTASSQDTAKSGPAASSESPSRMEIMSQGTSPITTPAAPSTAPKSPTGIGEGVAGSSGTAQTLPLTPPSVIEPYYPSPIEIKFKYTGGSFTIPDSGKVFRRVKGAIAGNTISETMKKMNFAGINLQSFKNAKLQAFTLSEDVSFGYILNVNLEDGSISIGENWTKWEYPGSNCADEECLKKSQLKPSQVPPNEKIIEMANSFLAEHEISRDEYGAPVVMDEWKMSAAKGMEPYAPDIITVIYPIEIQGMKSYEEGGRPNGMNVTVNIRHSRISGVWGILSQNYEESAYPLETDSKRILEIAERGGWYGGYIAGEYMAKDEKTRAIKAELGAPEGVLMRVWNPRGMANDELLVPALYFPVINEPVDPRIYQKAVAVPLVKELLDQAPNVKIMKKSEK